MSEQVSARDAEALPPLELCILGVALAACLWAWEVGGILGVIGCICGACVSYSERGTLSGAFGGLWAGVMLGGLVGGGILRLLDFVR